ncbi:hypothetical protein WCE10_22010, partial [Cronobacter muytjensii]|uniref:hypothetical protein n=1 Tax=Cronobacter muytjensii TaxID=413501 RepID=UPI0034D4538C
MKTYVFVKLPATSLPFGMAAANTIEQLFEEISMVTNPYDVVFKELKDPYAIAQASKPGAL